MNYADLSQRSLRGEPLTREEALAILRLPDEHLPALLDAAFQVRQHFFGKRVKLCVLQNARSGWCPEDCHYCSQSRLSTADIEKYGLLPVEQLLDGARLAVHAQAKRYCMVTSGRGPSDDDIAHFVEATRAIKAQFPHLEICVCLGLLTVTQAQRLKAAGVGWVNHNLNTSQRFYPQICTTHTYADRVQTVKNVRAAGLATCSGGIVGMGECDEDIVDLAFAVRELHIDSIPVNFLHPIPGTPMQDVHVLTPERGLKVLCLVRLLNPSSDVRAAGGRELNLREQQGRALYPANSVFVEGYLTTPGQAAAAARQMIESLGFEVEVNGGS